MDANYAELNIRILGMNPIFEEAGNPSITEGRDIPWLQDVDSNDDGRSDNWLNSWPFEYRDVIIVDAAGVAVDTFNLTIHSLEEPDSYQTFKQMLLDVATSEIAANDDVFNVSANQPADLDVLTNDGGSRRLSLAEVTQPAFGSTEIVEVEFDAPLDPIDQPPKDLVLSEIVPGEYIELYNSSFFAPVELSSVEHVLVSGNSQADLATWGAGVSVPTRGYERLAWPAGFLADSAAGEFILYRDATHGYDAGWKMLDFVAWGSPIVMSRIDIATEAGLWEGPPDGTLDLAAIQRIPGTLGNEAHSYDNHRPSTPHGAINHAKEVREIIRFTPPADFVGNASFTYTVEDDAGQRSSGDVTVAVSAAPTPWKNSINALDVNNDGVVSAADVHSIITLINAGFVGDLPTKLASPQIPSPYVDCDGSNSLEPRDALMIINYLNEQAQAAAQQDSAFGVQARIAGQGEPISEMLDELNPQIKPAASINLTHEHSVTGSDALSMVVDIIFRDGFDRLSNHARNIE